MAWSSLGVGTRLDNAPLVLAGPILRKVTNESVTVWVATKEACTVKLKLAAPASAEVQALTIKLGVHLHMVAVTLRGLSLVEGVKYHYDMEFKRATVDQWISLRLATHDAPLYYGNTYETPSFSLPPSDLNRLRIVHGSCRTPHGPGDLDALSLVDDLILESLADPSVDRPHQLLLTGDQIYADEVAAGLLTMITDAANHLLGHGTSREQMPLPPSTGSLPAPRDLPGSRGWAYETEMAPYQRMFALYQCGFTSVHMGCHLMTLGEYLAMYLFTWSDVLWDDDGPDGLQLPSVEYIAARMDELQDFMPHPLKDRDLTDFSIREMERRADGSLDYWHRQAYFMPKPARTYAVRWPSQRESVKESIRKHNAQLKIFHSTLKRVRRVLAHVPTYMIFDDHEVTDDWNMRLDRTVQIHNSPTGRRVVQNALVAYALCQHWGNCPEQFAPDGDHSPPGVRLLQKLDGATGAQYVEESDQVAKLVGLPPAEEIEDQQRMYHPAGSLIYNYAIEGPAHQIVVTDTRSWREFPPGRDGSAALLGEAQMRQQLGPPTVQPLAGRALLVVLTTNAPPIRAIRAAEGAEWLANAFKHVPDIYEAWTLGNRDADLLFKVLSDQLPLVDGVRKGAVMLLSGDVHHSFATRMLFEGTSRYGDAPGREQPVDAVFVQLVSSSLRNEDESTREIGKRGHDYNDEGIKSRLIPIGRQEVMYGWNASSSNPRWVAIWDGYPLVFTESGTIGGAFGGIATKVGAIGMTKRLILGEPKLTLKQPADWKYIVTYLSCPPAWPTLPSSPPSPGLLPRLVALSQYRRSLNEYREVTREGNFAKEAVGVNNVCEITFEGSNQNRFVKHTMRWSEARDSLNAPLKLRRATIPVSLTPND
jgi:hypothetical protein